MNKQEYRDSTAIIMADKKLGHTNRMTELRYIDAEYISSLEAENAALTLLHTQATDEMLKMQNRVHELEAKNAKLYAEIGKLKGEANE